MSVNLSALKKVEYEGNFLSMVNSLEKYDFNEISDMLNEYEGVIQLSRDYSSFMGTMLRALLPESCNVTFEPIECFGCIDIDSETEELVIEKYEDSEGFYTGEGASPSTQEYFQIILNFIHFAQDLWAKKIFQNLFEIAFYRHKNDLCCY